MTLHEDIDFLRAKALEYGAKRVAELAAAAIVIDPRARLKCIAPRCANYGRKLLCPPNVPSLGEVKEFIGAYSVALLVQSPIPVPTETIERFSDGKEADAVDKRTEYWEPIRQSQLEFDEMLRQVEREAFFRGYRFAAALGSEHCALCEECVGPSGECRHPFKARPSMSAMSIDVFATARNAGLSIEIPPREHSWWTGVVLLH
jgi:predicted metal-binding protein